MISPIRRGDPTRSSCSATALLLIAAREPTPGFTKTRLGQAIGMERAATLYRAFLADLATRFTVAAQADDPPFDLGWAFTPAECDFAQVLAGLDAPPEFDARIRFVPQHGPDWGVRQANLLRSGHDAGYQRTILTASDSPQMPVAVVLDAFAKLEEHDVVLGRVTDGGYYLIGVRGPHDVLSGVPMSTADAADGVLQRAEQLGLSAAEVEPTFDIDIVDDVEQLRDLCRRDPNHAPETARALENLGI